jgi:hypothetical protein
MSRRRSRVILVVLVALVVVGGTAVAASTAVCTAPVAPAEARLVPIGSAQGSGLVGMSMSELCPPLASVVWLNASVDVQGADRTTSVHIHSADGRVLFTLFTGAAEANGRIVDQRFAAFGRDDIRTAICSDTAYVDVHVANHADPALQGQLRHLGTKC